MHYENPVGAIMRRQGAIVNRSLRGHRDATTTGTRYPRWDVVNLLIIVVPKQERRETLEVRGAVCIHELSGAIARSRSRQATQFVHELAGSTGNEGSVWYRC